MEKVPKPNVKSETTLETSPNYVENVLSQVEICAQNPESEGCQVSVLHESINTTEAGQAFEIYEKHRILTFQDITSGVKLLSSHLERVLETLDASSEDFEYIQKEHALIRERDNEIGQGVRRYVRSVAKFVNLKKLQPGLDPEDFKYKMEDADSSRRRAHNALIKSLSIYTQVVTELNEEGFFPKDASLVAWDKEVDIQENNPERVVIYIFSSKILENRNLVKDWAISAHLHERLHDIEETQKKHADVSRMP